jgi:hypothetical protein
MAMLGNFISATTWDPALLSSASAPDNQVKNTATLQALEQFNDATGAFRILRNDLIQEIAINTVNILNAVRAIVTDFLAPFFPAFAAREFSRAAIINDQSREVLSNVMPMWRLAATEVVKKSGYTGDMDTLMGAFGEARTKKSLDPLMRLGIPNTVLKYLLDNIDPLTAYSLALDYDRQLVEQNDSKHNNTRAIVVTAELGGEQAKRESINFLNLSGYRIKLAAQSGQDPGYIESDTFYNMKELRERLRRESDRIRKEDERVARMAEEKAAVIGKLRADINNAHSVSLARMYQYGKKNFGPFGFTYGNGTDNMMLEFDTTADAISNIFKSGFDDAQGTDFTGQERIVSLKSNAMQAINELARTMRNSQQWQNGEFSGNQYNDVLNYFGLLAEKLADRGMREEALHIRDTIWIPIAEFLGTLPGAVYADIDAGERVDVHIPLIDNFIPDRIRNLIDNKINRYSPTTALREHNRRVFTADQSSYLLESGVLDTRDDGSKHDQAALDTVIKGYMGEIINAYAEAYGLSSTNALLDKLFNSTDNNYIQAADGGNGDLILTINLDGTKGFERRIKDIIGSGGFTTQKFDIWEQLGGRPDPQQ